MCTHSNKLKVKPSIFAILLILVLVGSSAVFADITYTLDLNGVDTGIRTQIETAIAEAVSFYNQQGSFNKSLYIIYDSSVTTADGNYNGTIRFGGSRNTRVALHEILHTLGVGQLPAWSATLSGGVWTGTYGNAQLAAFDGAGSVVHGDTQHFWPYGLNYDSEDNSLNRFRSVRVVAALRADMGLVSFVQEPAYQIVQSGSTAVFSVTVVGASSYAWYKQGNSSPLTNGGDISGAASNTLHIANAEVADEGRYYCVSGGLTSRPASLMILRTTPQLVGHWQFDNNLNDSVGPNHGTITGSATYATGQTGQCIDLDAVDDHVTLPAGIANYNDITVAAWVYWDGGGQWQRIFDFGNGSTTQYMFLTPCSGSNTLRFVIKNGSTEQIVQTASQLTSSQWVHLAVTLSGNTATLYVNGTSAATNTSVTINPSDFSTTINYIGDSQWVADPLFNGRIDDFRIYNYALSAVQVAALAAGNTAPTFTSDPISNLDAIELESYSGQSLAAYAYDVDGINTVTFSKDSGPDWLVVAGDGTLSGIPGDSDTGENVFTVRAQDSGGLFDTAQMTIQVANIYSGVGGLDDLVGFASQWRMQGCVDIPACDGADLDGDHDVDLADFSGLAKNWLALEDIQLYFKFDETSGDTAQDDSIYSRPGLLFNNPVWASEGVSGGALNFDGIDDYVLVSGYKGVAGTASRTCAAWIKTNTVSGQVLTWGDYAAGQKWVIRVNENGTLRAEVQSGYIYGTKSLTDNQWHHIAVVLANDGSPNISEARLYVDGQLETTGGVLAYPINTGVIQDVQLGVFTLVAPTYFNGLIDDVRIYSRALTDAEITALAQ